MLSQSCTPVVIHRHWLTLVPTLIGDACLAGAASVGVVASSNPLFRWIPIVLAVLLLAVHVSAWMVFRITFTHRTIIVQKLRHGLPRHSVYPYTSFDAIYHFQCPLGALCDSGTVIITTATKKQRFSGMTSYSTLTRVLH